jgi:Cutinase
MVRGSCLKYDLLTIIARGTGEPVYPKFGIIIGDPLWKAVEKLVPKASGYSVNYPADAAPCSRALGSQDVINRLKAQSSQCPNQKYALVGYSQGAGVIHAAMKDIDASLYPKIVALVMFGDFGSQYPQLCITASNSMQEIKVQTSKPLSEQSIQISHLHWHRN